MNCWVLSFYVQFQLDKNLCFATHVWNHQSTPSDQAHCVYPSELWIRQQNHPFHWLCLLVHAPNYEQHQIFCTAWFCREWSYLPKYAHDPQHFICKTSFLPPEVQESLNHFLQFIQRTGSSKEERIIVLNVVLEKCSIYLLQKILLVYRGKSADWDLLVYVLSESKWLSARITRSRRQSVSYKPKTKIAILLKLNFKIIAAALVLHWRVISGLSYFAFCIIMHNFPRFYFHRPYFEVFI